MAVTNETPQVARGFLALQTTLFRHAPKQLGKVILAGKQIRAVTSTQRGKH